MTDATRKSRPKPDAEMDAIRKILAMLKELPVASRARVRDYVLSRDDLFEPDTANIVDAS